MSTATATVAFESSEVTLHHGDCLDVLATLPDCSVDSVVTDPPYGLANTDPSQVADTIIRWVNGERDYLPGGSGFMGKSWDAFVPPVAVWDECLRVLKPGGHVLAFAGSRTVDLMTLGLRLAGFDIRDSIAWLYGSGFPKSMDVAQAIDKAARGVPQGGADPTSANHGNYKTSKTEGKRWDSDKGQSFGAGGSAFLTSTASERKARPSSVETADGSQDRTLDATAREWQGWGTALKPAFEPIVVARKPLAGTVAANVLAHGTGALNIDATRIGDELRVNPPAGQGTNASESIGKGWRDDAEAKTVAGRWPANVVLDESQAAALDEQSGTLTSGFMRAGTARRGNADVYGADDRPVRADTHGDSGGASRFFYTAKADSAERPVVDGIAHPTVKPLDLMRYLVRLVTPRGGVVLEPFAGSGTTLEAAVLEGFRAIGIEREADYIPLITKRLDKPHEVGLDLFGEVA